jgi:hypothetical protein
MVVFVGPVVLLALRPTGSLAVAWQGVITSSNRLSSVKELP